VKVIAGSAVCWPLDLHAQQPERMRRIGVLMNFTADDPEGQVRIKTLLQGLKEQGWMAATCASIRAGPEAKSSAIARAQLNWSAWRRTSFLPVLWRPCRR
jgi:hypothetical protein